jgi:ABC-type uncharacterized transport system ATPase subunit
MAIIAHDDRPALLELRAITKRFPGVTANDGIDLSVGEARIHALLGENGAGKSTLVKIIYGVTEPDAGAILWQGRPVSLASPAAARALGIGMVFQHFTLFETLTVAENMALVLDEPIRRRALARRVREVVETYGLALHPEQHVHELSVGERQRVEIVRCLLQRPKLLIMDEPTSVLAPGEVETLFAILVRLAADGCSILFISHKLEEVRALCSEATVLRHGRVVARCDPRAESAGALARLMVGGALPEVHHRGTRAVGAPVLEIDRLSFAPPRLHGVGLDQVSLTVRAGEIVGIAGVAGNGQAALLAALNGEQPAPRADAIRIAGRSAGRLAPPARRRRGLAFVPEERFGRGAVGAMSLADNALLTAAHTRSMLAAGLVRRARVTAFASQVIDDFDVVCSGPDAEAQSLSGGNMQKFILGREVLQRPRILVAAHPTWGVDVGAARRIEQALIDLSDGGGGVLVVSEDLDELFEICDRIAVISRGRLSPAVAVAEVDRGTIGEWMTGLAAAAAPDAADAGSPAP